MHNSQIRHRSYSVAQSRLPVSRARSTSVRLSNPDAKTNRCLCLEKLRGGRKLNTNTENLKPVPKPKNAYISYIFFIDIPVIWQRITNGEKVLIQYPTTRKLNTNDFEIKSSNPVHPQK